MKESVLKVDGASPHGGGNVLGYELHGLHLEGRNDQKKVEDGEI